MLCEHIPGIRKCDMAFPGSPLPGKAIRVYILPETHMMAETRDSRIQNLALMRALILHHLCVRIY